MTTSSLFKEHRLIGLLASQFSDPTKYNARTAQANAQQQNDGHQQAVVENQAAGKVLTRTANQYVPDPVNAPNPQLQAAKSVYGNQDAGLQSSVTNSLDPITGLQVQGPVQAEGSGVIQQKAIERLRASGMNDQQIQEKMSDPNYINEIQRTMSNTGLPSTDRVNQVNDSLDGRLAAIDKKYQNIVASGNSVDQAGMEAEKATAIAKYNSEQDTAARDKKAAQDKLTAQTDASTPEAGVTTTGTNPAAPKDAGAAAAFANLPPEYAFLGPLFQQQQDTINNAINSNKNQTESQFNANDAAYGSVADSIAEMKAGYAESNAAIQDILKDVKEDNEKSISEQESAARQRATWTENQMERQAAKQKAQAHDSMVAQIALSGGFAQDAGLAAVAASDAEFDNRIDDMRTELGVQNTELSAKFTAMYVENRNNYANNTITNVKDLKANLERLSMQGNQNTVAWTTAQNNLLQTAWTNQTNLRKELATNNYNAGKDMITVVNQSRDDKRSQEQLGWNILNQAIDNYGSMVPKSIVDRVSGMLPKGTDIQDIINTPTFAERNSKRISGAGGGTSSGVTLGGGKTAAPGIASQFSNMNPQELKSAVDRAMLKFGGTGGERAAKRNEYMNRIASGEATGNIVADLIKDYWATTTGPNETTHNQRISAAGNMDAIQSYADSYGVSEGADGPLGPVSSRGEWLASFFGKSSDAYNDIRSMVSNVKGQITKANAGTAVSAYELSLLKEYAPSMDLKGPTFFANIRNYKALVDYLDAKQAAVDLGIPAPALPIPIKMSGTDIVGAGKYSDEDINSTLNE